MNAQRMSKWFAVCFLLALAAACNRNDQNADQKTGAAPLPSNEETLVDEQGKEDSDLLKKYTQVTLTTDTALLSENQRKILPLLIEAANAMDEVFWLEAYGPKQALLDAISDPQLRQFAVYNYGPWDRLDNNTPFVENVGPKPAGAHFYPSDVSKDEVNTAEDESVRSQYTVVVRDDDGKLKGVPYHVAFAEQHQRAAQKLKEAAALAEDAGFKSYLEKRAEALLTDDYYASDLAWMDMKTNQLDIVIGPIENYEDQLMGRKTAHASYVLVKDMAWSERLAKFAQFLPELQRKLPVPEQYKQETPGSDSDLNAYDVVYYAGDCNAGSKTIAINLPNDENVQMKKGTRRLQLKNAMRAKFDKILVPIGNVLIAEDQRRYITFNAFFTNTMFHEVAHGLGIKNTVDGKGTVREALLEKASALEEGKADILGLYMVLQLLEKGEIEGEPEEYMVTFMSSIFRSVRFGASSAHGRANMLRFNFFQEMEAFTRDEASGTYRVNFEKMRDAMNALSRLILTLQGDGDYDGVSKLMAEKGVMKGGLQEDLNRLISFDIPVDVVFDQGTKVLGL